MGVSYYVYIGPFIEAPNPKKASSREFFGCPKHKTPASDKFCNRCGAAIQLVSVPSLERIEFDTYEEFHDSLDIVHRDNLPENKEDFMIFQPNRGKLGKRFSAYDSSLIEMNETVMLDEVNRMRTEFAKEIARLAEVFGKAEVKWGAIAYAS